MAAEERPCLDLNARIGEPDKETRMMQLRIASMVMVCCGVLTGAAASTRRVPEHPFLKEKPRILVDKVLMAGNNWVMTEQHVREIKAAGFNVVCPRIGGTDPARIRKVAAMAQRHGMF